MEMEGLERKAKASGASQLVVKDLKEEFVRDYIFHCLRAGAVYERKYLLGTSMARPVIAKTMVDVAKEVGADAVAHGCTGKGNDQVFPPGMDFSNIVVQEETTETDGDLAAIISASPKLISPTWSETFIMGTRDDIDKMSSGNASVLITVLKLIDKYDLLAAAHGLPMVATKNGGPTDIHQYDVKKKAVRI